MAIKKVSPTRVDFSGGTLDCWPLYLFLGDCVTVNLSIDIKTYATIEPREDKKVIVDVTDLGYKKEFENLSTLINSTDKELSLVKCHLEYWMPEQGLELRTQSESPVGGGLGGSSSLSISLLRAFSQWLQKDLSLYEMVKLASHIEARVLKTPTGTQDYFPAVSPGLNAIHYGIEGPKLEFLDFDAKVLEDHLLLVNTGKSHHSGINNWQVIKSVIDGETGTLNHLKKIADISSRTYEVIKNKAWHKLPDLFREEFDARVDLCSSFSSPEIEKLNKLVDTNGGLATKICGAGGGGCVLVWAHPENKLSLKAVIEAEGFQTFLIKPVTKEVL